MTDSVTKGFIMHCMLPILCIMSMANINNMKSYQTIIHIRSLWNKTNNEYHFRGNKIGLLTISEYAILRNDISI